MNKKSLLAYLMILPILALPISNAVLSAPTYLDEGHAITPYLVTTVKVIYEKPLATQSLSSSSIGVATLHIEAGFIPTPERAIAIAKVYSLDGLRPLANSTDTAQEFKTDADEFTVNAKLDFLNPIEEIDIVQANATWVSVNAINSTGKYHILLISWAKNFTITKVYLDNDDNVTNGYKVIFDGSYTGNLFWLPIPYGLWTYVYLEFSGEEIPAVKFLKNAIPVLDHRFFKEENVVVEDTPEQLEEDVETTNMFIGTANLHSFILNIIKGYIKENFGSDTVYGYNVTQAKFSLKIGKYLKYQGAIGEVIKLDLFDIGSVFDTVTLTIGTSLDEIKETVSGTINQLQQTTTAVVTDAVAQADTIGADVVKVFSDLGADINSFLKEAGLSLDTLVNNVGKTLSEAIAEQKQAVIDFTAEMLEAVSVAIGETVNQTIQFSQKAFGVVTGFIQRAKVVLLGFVIIAVILISSIIILPLIKGKKIRFGGGREK